MAMAKTKAKETNTIKLGSREYVVLPKKEFESMEETLEILTDKETMKSIRKGEEDLRKGRTVRLEELKKEIKSQ